MWAAVDVLSGVKARSFSIRWRYRADNNNDNDDDGKETSAFAAHNQMREFALFFQSFSVRRSRVFHSFGKKIVVDDVGYAVGVICVLRGRGGTGDCAGAVRALIELLIDQPTDSHECGNSSSFKEKLLAEKHTRKNEIIVCGVFLRSSTILYAARQHRCCVLCVIWHSRKTKKKTAKKKKMSWNFDSFWRRRRSFFSAVFVAELTL